MHTWYNCIVSNKSKEGHDMLLMYVSLIEDDREKSKFEQLYEKYRDMMYYKAYNILQDCYLAEDAVHDAFLRIAKNMYTIKEVESLKTKAFVLTVTKNRAIDLYRRRKKRTYIEKEVADNFKRDKENQEDVSLKYMIMELPDIYRDVLELKYYHGYTYKEISKIQNIKPQTVGLRLHRAKQMLQEKLDEIEGDF